MKTGTGGKKKWQITTTTLRFIYKKKYEMCDSIDCDECPFHEKNNGKSLNCDLYEKVFPTEAIAAVKQWHEKKDKGYTYRHDFFDKFPSAARTSKGYPLATACFIYPKIRCKDCPSSSRTCDECWDIKMEEI